MNKTSTPHQRPSLQTQLLKYLLRISSVRDSVRRVLLGLCVLIFILFEWHIIPPDAITHEGLGRQIILSLLVVFGAFVVELLFDTRQSIEKASHDVSGLVQTADGVSNDLKVLHQTVRGVSKNVSRLKQNVSSDLQDLLRCIENLSQALRDVRPEDRLIVKHLGLNMEQAWSYLRKDILGQKMVKKIELRLLMLPNDAAEIIRHSNHPVPADVVRWCMTVKEKIQTIEESLKTDRQRLGDDRRVQVIIKQYRTLPIFHGFSISGPFEACCLSVCRWKRSEVFPGNWEYDWGEFSYHTIWGNAADESAADLAAIFDAHFEYLWATSGEPVVSFKSDDLPSLRVELIRGKKDAEDL